MRSSMRNACPVQKPYDLYEPRNPQKAAYFQCVQDHFEDMEKSFSILKKWIETQPDSATARFRIAHIYKLLRKNEKASQWYLQAIEKGYKPIDKQVIEIK